MYRPGGCYGPSRLFAARKALLLGEALIGGKMKTQADNSDLWVLLLSCVRYSMGRMTYMSSLAWELVLRYQGALTTWQLEQIAEEIEAEVERAERMGGKLGHDCDHESWIRGAGLIRKAVAAR